MLDFFFSSFGSSPSCRKREIILALMLAEVGSDVNFADKILDNAGGVAS